MFCIDGYLYWVLPGTPSTGSPSPGREARGTDAVYMIETKCGEMQQEKVFLEVPRDRAKLRSHDGGLRFVPSILKYIRIINPTS